MHLHGGFGNKANEGIKYNDDTTGYETNDDELAQYGMSNKDCSQVSVTPPRTCRQLQSHNYSHDYHSAPTVT